MDSRPLSSAPTVVSEIDDTKTITAEADIPSTSLAELRPLQKNVLLAIFCLGQFLDIMNTSAMLPALPATSASVGLTESDSVWLFAAYQATFASFLLIVSASCSRSMSVANDILWVERAYFRHLRSQAGVCSRFYLFRRDISGSGIHQQPYRVAGSQGPSRNWRRSHHPVCAEYDRADVP